LALAFTIQEGTVNLAFLLATYVLVLAFSRITFPLDSPDIGSLY